MFNLEISTEEEDGVKTIVFVVYDHMHISASKERLRNVQVKQYLAARICDPSCDCAISQGLDALSLGVEVWRLGDRSP